MKKGILTLAFGTFALGMTEYVMMSILPDLASAFGTSVADAGHLISVYAIGVCVGAPLSAIFLRNWELRKILILLMAVLAVGNLMFALCPNFHVGLVSRFISGLPHGAFFGTGTIVASRLMPDKQTTAVSLMTLGMTTANLLGIPLGSFIANTLDWRWIFLFNAAWATVTLLMFVFLVKGVGSLPPSRIASEFKFLKSPAPWILILFTLLCQGGCFAMYSYVTPIMGAAGLAQKYIPILMIIVGASMSIGNYVAGVLSDRFSPGKIALVVSMIMTVVLLSIYFESSSMIMSGVSVVIATACLFALSSPMQLLLLKYSPGGELLGGAAVQIAFNLGNAIGATIGGLALTKTGMPATASLYGTALAAASIFTMLLFIRRYSRKVPNVDTGKK